MSSPRLTIRPLAPERWGDLEALFGPRGCAGCWCMWFRVARAEFQAGLGDRNRRALKRLVEAGQVPGLIAYAGREPVGWCAVEPRSAYPRLSRSRLLAPVDDAPAWSVTCFYVAPAWRGRGVTAALIDAAARHARRGGARVLEAYPVDRAGRSENAALYHGAASTFLRAGFREVARRSATRPVLRRTLGAARRSVSRAASRG